MAQISLGNLRDLWQNVSDWVKGVDTVSAPSVKLTGSNVELQRKLNVTITPGSTIYFEDVSLRDVSSFYFYGVTTVGHSFKLLILYKHLNGSSGLTVYAEATYSKTTTSAQINTGKMDVKTLDIAVGIQNNDTVDRAYDAVVGGIR
jgi:hypothetical protein